MSAVAREPGVQRSVLKRWMENLAAGKYVGQCTLDVEDSRIHNLSSDSYGSPRIWKDLVVAGECCSENRVARLMQAAKLHAQTKPR
jgi:hypothetical protein